MSAPTLFPIAAGALLFACAAAQEPADAPAAEPAPTAAPAPTAEPAPQTYEVPVDLEVPEGAAGTEHPYETDALRRPGEGSGADVLFRGVTVHTAVGEPFTGGVLVRDGVIVAVGPDVDGSDVPEFRLVDGAGLHLAPGAIDSHSHMAIDGGVNEGSLSITADCDMTDVVDAEDLSLQRALAGGTTTIQILHGSANAIGGRSELLKLRGIDATAEGLRYESGPQGIKFALGENPKRSNWGSGGRFPATRLGVEAVFRRAFERAREYRAEWERYDAAVADGGDPPPLRRDVLLDALVDVLDGDLVVHSHCYRADEILMLLRVAESFDFRIGTLHHVLEGYKVAAEIAAHGAGTATFSDWWAYKVEAYDAIPGNAAILDEAGVVSGLKSDSAELVRHLYHEAAKSVGYAGVDRVRALQFVTLNPAIQLGVDDRLGSIEVGKDADLVLFDGDPLSVYSKVLATFVEGRLVFERRDAFGLDAGFEPNFADRSPRPALPVDPEGGKVTAIVGGTVHTAVGEPVEGGTVLVQGDRLLAVGADVVVPEDATVVDAAGLHVYPGLVALETRLGVFEISAVQATMDAAEIGGDQPDLRVAASLHPESAHLGVTRYNGVTRAQTAPTGGRLRGQSAVIRLDGLTWEELLQVDGDMLHVGFPRVSNTADDKEREGKSESLHELEALFRAATEYGRAAQEAERLSLVPPPHDPRLEALTPFAAGERPVALHASNAQTILHALRFAEELELDAVLYGAGEGWKVVDALAAAQVPVVLEDPLGRPGEYDPYDAPYANAAVLARAGVPYAIGTGSGDNPRNLPYMAGFAAAFGLPRDEALRAVTLHPATVLGLGAELGSLEPGKLADVVLADGDLLEPTTRVQRVWIDGREASLENRQTELHAKYLARLRGE